MTLTDLDRARAAIGRIAEPLPAEHRGIDEAGGLRLAAAVSSPADLPAADVSAMDGYAVRVADLRSGAPLPVAFEVPAGGRLEPLPEGSAARIFTGALLPEGADTVVPQEQAHIDGGRVRFQADLEAGAFVRARAEVIEAGQPLASKGERLTPPRVALLAAAGAARVPVIRRPWLGLVTTGAEVVPAEEEPQPGQIRDANGPLLRAAAELARVQVVASAHAPDEPAAVAARVREALDQAEVVLVSGGVSVGDHDHVPAAVRELGGHVLLHRLSIKPGRPLLVGRFGTRWLLGLPGNPLSCLVCWRLFARPLIEALAGDPAAFEETPLQAALTGDVVNGEDRIWLRPARLSSGPGDWRAEPLGWKGSHDVASCAPADALLRIEPQQVRRAGEAVPVYPFDWERRIPGTPEGGR